MSCGDGCAPAEHRRSTLKIVRILRGELPPVETALTRGEPFLEDAGDLAALASEQGVLPVEDTDSLSGDFWPMEESTDDFLDALQAWREEDKVHSLVDVVCSPPAPS